MSLQLRRRSSRQGTLTHVWSSQQPLTLQGEGEWLIQGPADLLQRAARGLEGFYEPMGPESAILKFGNAVGRFEAPGLGTLCVVSGKWGEEHFNRMLADLMREAASLPFSIGVRAQMPYDRSVAQQGEVLYHAFVYLRHILSETAPQEARLLPALRQVLAEPHRRLDNEQRPVPSEHVRSLDARGLVQIMERPHHWSAVPPELARRSALASALKQHLPREVEERAVRASYDTPENQFVKSFLEFTAGIISGIRQNASRQAKRLFVPRVLADCEWMERVLHPIQSHALWKRVGPMVNLPASSTVLQNRHGYKAIFGHFSKLRLASSCLPLSAPEVMRLLEVKDIALLYELWTYFQLVEQVRTLLGPPTFTEPIRPEPWEIKAPHGLTVRWRGGVEASFNATYSRSSRTGRRSYSVRLIPDISLLVPGETASALHLFDAKFKLERIARKTEDNDEDSEQSGSFRNEDLYKMHTYRDAIAQARTAWILYPGNEFICFSAHGEKLQKPEALDTDVSGIGAIPMRPGETEAALRTVLARLLPRR